MAVLSLFSVLTLFSATKAHSDWGVSKGRKGQSRFGDVGKPCDPCDCHNCNGGVSAEETCEFGSFIQCVWLWKNVLCNSHCLVALDTCPLSQHTLASVGTWVTEEVWATICGSSVVWKPLTDLGQREGKQQRDGERQEPAMATQRTQRGKERARWWQAGSMWPGQQWRRDSGQGSAATGQQHAGPRCGQTQTLAISNTQPIQGSKQTHWPATTRSQLRNKDRSLPQERRTARSPKHVPSRWFCYNPTLFMCASNRAWGPQSLCGSGALRCWVLPQGTGMAMLFPRWSPCLPERWWGWTYTPLDMMLLLAGTSLSLGHSVAEVVLRLPIHGLEGLYSGLALVQVSPEGQEGVWPQSRNIQQLQVNSCCLRDYFTHDSLGGALVQAFQWPLVYFQLESQRFGKSLLSERLDDWGQEEEERWP